MNAQRQGPSAAQRTESRGAAVNRVASSAFRQTFGVAVTCAGIVTLAAQAAARLHGLA